MFHHPAQVSCNPLNLIFQPLKKSFQLGALGGAPVKRPKKRYSEDEKVSSHAKRQHECTGPCLIPLDSTANRYSTKHKCFVCDRKTKWWCYGCRQFFAIQCQHKQKIRAQIFFIIVSRAATKMDQYKGLVKLIAGSKPISVRLDVSY